MAEMRLLPVRDKESQEEDESEAILRRVSGKESTALDFWMIPSVCVFEQAVEFQVVVGEKI